MYRVAWLIGFFWVLSLAHAFRPEEPFNKKFCESNPFSVQIEMTRDFPGEVLPRKWGEWPIWIEKCGLDEIVGETKKAVEFYQKLCGKCSTFIAYINAHGKFVEAQSLKKPLPPPLSPQKVSERISVDTKQPTPKAGSHYLECGDFNDETKPQYRGRVESAKVYAALNELFEKFKCQNSQIWNDSCQSGMCSHSPQCSNGSCVMLTSGKDDATTPGQIEGSTENISNFKEWSGAICRKCDDNKDFAITFGEYGSCFAKLRDQMPKIESSRIYFGPPVIAGDHKKFADRVFFSCRDLTQKQLQLQPHHLLTPAPSDSPAPSESLPPTHAK